MKKQFTELIGVFSTLVFLILLTPTNLSAQCAAGEAEYTVSLLVGGSFAAERGVEVVPANGDPSFFLVDCDDYPTAPVGEYVDFTFCAVIGEDYTINYRDDFGDGWNMADEPSPWIVLNGPIEVGSGGNPNNGSCCNIGAPCGEADIEDSFTFTAAPPADCTVPDVVYTVTEDCETNTYDITVDLNDFGADDNGVDIVNLTVFLEDDSDDYDVPNDQITFPFFTEGTTQDLIVDVPFGVTITATPVVGIESVCNQSTDLTNDNVCPPPNDECSEAIEIGCGETVSGNTANAAAPPQGAIDAALDCAQSTGTTITTGGAWYVFTAPFNAIINANTCGSDVFPPDTYDTKLHAFQTDDCETFSCVAADDDAPFGFCTSSGLHSSIDFSVNAGDVIYFYITGFGTDFGGYNFTVNCTELLCTNPTIVFEAQDLDGNALTDCQEVGDQYQLAITLTDIPGDDPNLDFTVSAGGLTEAAAVADQEFILGPYNAGTNVTIDAIGNQDALCSSSEPYTSEICPPENNTPCTATVVECEGTYFGTNIGADPAADGEFCDFSSISGIVYYEFTNPEPNNLLLSWNTCNPGTDFDTDSHLFDGPCDALSCRPMSGQAAPGGYVDGQLDPNTGGSSPSCLDAGSTWATGGEVILGPGETVFIGIDGFGGLQGVFELTIDCQSILCSSPVVTATPVEVGTDTEIVDCQDVTAEYEVQVVITGGSGNDDYTLTVGGAAPIADAVSDVVYTFGPFPSGSTQNVLAAGNTDDQCSDDTSVGTTICPPDNNTPCTATVVDCGVTYFGTNLGADPAPAGEFCDFSSLSGIVYYEWTNTGEGDVLFSWNTCNPGTNFDTDSHFFDGPCDALSCRPMSGQTAPGGYSDGQLNPETGGSSASCDNAGSTWATGGEAIVGAGETVFVGIDGFSTLQGVFEVVFNCQDLECSPTAEATVVADAEGTPVEGCLPQEGSYWVSVDVIGGSEQPYNVSVNGSDPVVADENGNAIVGPVGTLETADILVQGVDNNLCSATLSVTPDDICGPANDNICDALFVPADGSVGLYSTLEASVEEGEPTAPAGTAPNSCQSQDGWCFFQLNLLNTVWFETTVPPSGRYTITTCGPDTDFDTQIAVYSGDCQDFGSLIFEGANDDQVGGCPDFFSASTLTLCGEPGSTVLIQIDAGDTFGGNLFNLSISEVEDNAFCDCVQPVIPPGFTFAESFPICDDPENLGFGVNWFAPEDIGSSEFFVYVYDYPSNPGDPIEVEVPAGGTVTTFDNVPLGEIITVSIFLSDPSCDEINPILTGAFGQPADGCAEDCEGTPGGTAVPGTPCVTENEEPGTWDADCVCQPAPDNDECDGAVEVIVDGDNGAGDNTFANGDPDGTITCGVAGDTDVDNDVWFWFVAPDAEVTLETVAGTNTDTQMQVWDACDGAVVGCDDDGGAGFMSLINFACGDLIPGNTYWVQVDGWNGNSGTFELSITSGEPCSSGNTIEGSVSWDTNCGERNATITIYEDGTDTELAQYDVIIDSDGNFSVDIAETGVVDVILKADGYLAKKVTDVELAEGANPVDFGALEGGDLTGTNNVGIADFSAFSATYGLSEGDPGYNFLADFVCDLVIGIADFSVFSSNYGEDGDQPGDE